MKPELAGATVADRYASFRSSIEPDLARRREQNNTWGDAMSFAGREEGRPRVKGRPHGYKPRRKKGGQQ